ncbi:MAG: PhoU domain-containing protein [Desulfosalsimonas sp.]
MQTLEGLDENLRFLIVETENQVRSIRTFLGRPSRKAYEKVISKDDYIDNLKTVIENKCFTTIHSRQPGKKEINKIRSIQTIAVNLERMADFCVNIARQTGYLDDPAVMNLYGYEPAFEQIEQSLNRILPVFYSADLSGALSICKTEYGLDEIYKNRFERIMGELQSGGDAHRLITVLFIFRYLERIGDSMLNVGEALIFNILGERIKIEQFEALQTTLSKSGFKESIGEIDFQYIWGTRSGCRIGRVGQNSSASMAEAQGSIFKEGTKTKIAREKERLERWNQTFPGVTARIYGYNEENDSASMLVEFLPGCTLDECILATDEEILQNALFLFHQTILEVWETSRRDCAVETDYMDQISSRWESILRLHPDFCRKSCRINNKTIDSTQALLDGCRHVEAEVKAPFTVLIHGDLNANNVVYDHQRQRVYFIDLNRSRDFDYIQDVSVFLVSNFRLPVFETNFRARIYRIMEGFLRHSADFAAKYNDHTFDVRMALALARSFYTSTRFETNYAFAREMFLRAHLLMEKVIQHPPRPWEEFKLPVHVLDL